MPNKYICKTNRGQISVEIYELAVKEVSLRQRSFRDAASYNLNFTLHRFIKNKKAFDKNISQNRSSIGYLKNCIFTAKEEKILCEYLLTYSAANYDLSMKESRRLAYTQLTKEYNKDNACFMGKKPNNWRNMIKTVHENIPFSLYSFLKLRVSVVLPALIRPMLICSLKIIFKINYSIFCINIWISSCRHETGVTICCECYIGNSIFIFL